MPNIRLAPHEFEPAIFNDAELAFLLDHMDEAPVVALNRGVPDGVNVAMMQDWITKFFNLQQLFVHHDQPWAGFEAVKDSITRYLAWQDRCREIDRRSGGKLAQASMFSYDSQGGFTKYGIDSDSGFVRTEILPDGSRVPFGVKLLEPGGRVVNALFDVAPWINTSVTGGRSRQFNDELIVVRKGRFGKFECPICGKSEEFNTASKNAENLARSRMGKHLKNARMEVGRHRTLYRKKFGAPDVKL